MAKDYILRMQVLNSCYFANYWSNRMVKEGYNMKALVLFSGGVDSTTCLALAIDRYGKENVVALSVSYGQKHTKEVEAADKIAAYRRFAL